MSDTTTSWPQKTREIQTPSLDSTQWNGFAFRDDDVIVNTLGKSGTTWTQAILVQLIHGAPVAPRVNNISRWVDCGFDQEGRLEAVAAQTHRRVLKSHLPLDALVFSPHAKYIHVARDGRDMVWSAHNHLFNALDGFFAMLNAHPLAPATPARRPTSDRRAFFLEFMAMGDLMGLDLFAFERGWWQVRRLPNVHLLHFQNLKDDLPGEVDRLASFLGMKVDAAMKAKVLEHVNFEHMKRHADEMFPGIPLEGGGQSFINKGTNGRWRDELTAEDVASYEAKAVAALGADCAHWLATGRFA